MSEQIEAEALIGQADASLLDIVDHVLNQGIVLSGEVVLSVAGVDLIYLRVLALLCAADRILPREDEPPPEGATKSGGPRAGG